MSNNSLGIKPLDKQTALETLISGIKLAQSRGAFKLGESSQLAQAVVAFAPQEPPTPDSTPDSTPDNKTIAKTVEKAQKE